MEVPQAGAAADEPLLRRAFGGAGSTRPEEPRHNRHERRVKGHAADDGPLTGGGRDRGDQRGGVGVGLWRHDVAPRRPDEPVVDQEGRHYHAGHCKTTVFFLLSRVKN